ncbi:hypothetical protein BGX33_006741 [Mortierella sp. NVP41]|nr:hypothetical protein BGX33_006741 [Mortierella sp. NVP41]
MDTTTKKQLFKNPVDDQFIEVKVHLHVETNQQVVLWTDINEALPGVSTIKDASADVLALQDITPLCIKFHPESVLTVILEGELDPSDSDLPRVSTLGARQASIFTEDGTYSVVGFTYTESAGGASVMAPSEAGDGHANNAGVQLPDGPNIGVEQDIESVIGHLEITGPNDHYESTLDTIVELPNGEDRSETSSSSSNSESQEGSGSAVSTATTISPSNGDTATAAATTADSTATATATETEIDPVEAASSWAKIFRALGDLQERYQLTPEETTEMFTEITQSA